MNLLVVTKPIFNEKMDVTAYYFSFNFGNAILEGGKSNPLDRAMESPFIDFLNKVGLEALTMGKLIFVPVTNILLMLQLENICTVDRDKVVFLLGKDITLDSLCFERVKRYKELGFKIAFINNEDLNMLGNFLTYTDFIFLKLSPEQIRFKLNYLRSVNKDLQVIISNIETAPQFDAVKFSGAHNFTGSFYKVHISKGVQNVVSPLKVNYIQLLNIVSKDDFELKEVISVVQRDTALAIQFMRLVNSIGRITTEIKTINHAAAMLGQQEIKKWITTAVSSMLSQDKPSEVTRTSLIRAKFCENMARYFEMAIHKDNLFLMGMFSVLDVILELPISEALKIVFVPEQVKKALQDGTGDFYVVYNFVKCYEQADWHEVSRLAILYDISIKSIHDAYADSLVWYGELIRLTEGDEKKTS